MVILVGLAAALVSALLVGGARSASQTSGLIAFTRADGIYVMRTDGHGIHAIRRGGIATHVAYLAWSPDGSKLAWVGGETHDEDWSLWVMDADGTDPVRLIDGAWSPTWSPDGRRIAFTRSRPMGNDIWVVNADGSKLRRLRETPGDVAVDVDWSPREKRIAFSAGGYLLRLYVMNADGSDLRRLRLGRPDVLLDARIVEAAMPDWSPDGRKLAFMRWQGRLAQAEIYVADLRTGSRVRLTDNDLRDGDPSWSPDQRKVVFVRGGGNHALNMPPAERSSSEIFVMNADGTGLTRLTHNAVGEGSPAWQPVGAP